MSATRENAYCAEAWMDMVLLRTDLAQLREHNEGARMRLEQIRHETVLALWERRTRRCIRPLVTAADGPGIRIELPAV